MKEDQLNLPKICTKQSMKVSVQQGQKYLWCSCGLSSRQPFCDGKHKGSDFKPIIYQADDNKVVSFCGCKHSMKGPICDGSHKNL